MKTFHSLTVDKRAKYAGKAKKETTATKNESEVFSFDTAILLANHATSYA
jgi:hypothetical protein